ncbi:hypothetical protein R1sor_024581 [Riccia sorocarpa]|uniref:Uncharacterized protein n=1 Tax=Riccia sorocarpa TaxID=122646 RepID=A0ABD3GU49_9MARC
MDGDDKFRMKTDFPDEPEGDEDFLTIAYIYTEDTHLGFFVQVFQRHLSGPKSLRLVDTPVLEGSMEFMTVEPAEVFVTLGIKKIRENIDISVESLALRSPGHDRVEVSVSRHSSAKRLFHIIFNPVKEVIRIRVYELPVKTSSFVSFTAGVPTETAGAQTSSTSASTGEKFKPRGNEAADEVQTSTMGSAVANSPASKDKFLNFVTENIVTGWEQLGEDGGPVDHPDKRAKQGKLSNLIRGKKLETTCGSSSDKRVRELLPLLRPASRGVLCKKRVETAVSKAQGYVGSFFRKADPTIRDLMSSRCSREHGPDTVS